MSIPGIAEASALIAARKLSPVELTRACLARLHATEATLHAFVLPTEERALADARSAEAEILRYGPRGPLHGIPVGVKDIVDTAGIETTCGSKILLGNVPSKDAACAAALVRAGTVLMGKLTTHEFADGGPSFDLPTPPAANPWNPAHFTAGSSSGTGAAVAAGVILCGIGTDTGGSIRGPAALCGIAGLKPTYGLVSRAGVAPAAYSLDHIGPMAWTAEDCAIVLQALAVLVQQRLWHDVQRYQDRCELLVIPPLCPLSVAAVDFSHTRELIDRGYVNTRSWLDSGLPPNSPTLVPHSHDGLAARR